MIDLGEVTILTAEGPVADGGGNLDLALPLDSILHSIAIFPITASTEPTGVSSLLFEGANLITQIMPLKNASSGATFPFAAVEYPDLPLPEDRSYVLRNRIYNGAGAVKIWRVVVIVEVVAIV